MLKKQRILKKASHLKPFLNGDHFFSGLKFFIFLFVFSFFFQSLSFAKLRVVTTTTDLAFVLRSIGKDKLKVESLLDGSEDLHYVSALPYFALKISRADLVCFNGLAVEVGWFPDVLKKSRNFRVQKGRKGYCNAGKGVQALEIPVGNIDRSQGDFHVEGNPHYSLSITHLIQASKEILKNLVNNDPKNSKFYSENYDQFVKDLNKISLKVKDVLKDFDFSKKVSQYHKEFTYFFHYYGIQSSEAIEEIPGVPPSAARLAVISEQMKDQGVLLALYSPYHSRRYMEKFHKISKIPIVKLPASIQKKGVFNTYEKLQLGIAKAITKISKEREVILNQDKKEK